MRDRLFFEEILVGCDCYRHLHSYLPPLTRLTFTRKSANVHGATLWEGNPFPD